MLVVPLWGGEMIVSQFFVSIVSPPSELNGQFFYIIMSRTVHTIMLYVLLILRYRNIIHASNFVCALPLANDV